MHEKINSYLNEMQEESPNCGGEYHFTKVNLTNEESLINRLKSYLLNIEAYKAPFVTIGDEQKVVEERKIENLEIGNDIEIKEYEGNSVIVGLKPYDFGMGFFLLFSIPFLIIGLPFLIYSILTVDGSED